MTAINPASQTDTFVAVDIVPVTPDDTEDLKRAARAIRAQGDGTIRITSGLGMVRDTFITAGEILPVYATRIHATGTTATGIEALI